MALGTTLAPTVTLAEVNAVARATLTDSNRVVLIAAPAQPDVTLPTQADLLGVFARARGAVMTAYVDSVTDAPLIATQLDRIAQRAVMGIARVGGVGEHSSGDLVLAFSTANVSLPVENLEPARPFTTSVEMTVNAHLSPLFEATADATEAAIIDALLAGETMAGANGATALALPLDVLAAALR